MTSIVVSVNKENKFTHNHVDEVFIMNMYNQEFVSSITGNFLCFDCQLLKCNCGHRTVQRLFPHNPSSFCNAIWEKPLIHPTNTCHMLTLRVTATRPSSSSVTVTDPTWQLHNTIYIFTHTICHLAFSDKLAQSE